MSIYFVCLLGAFLLCLVATVLVRRVARRVGLVDQPDNHRKMHLTSVALGGGAAIFISTFGILGAVSWFRPEAFTLKISAEFFGLAFGSIVIVVVGLIDDKRGIRGWHKLMGQILAATLVAGSGITPDRIQLFGQVITLGPVSLPLTLAWLLLAINAFNLLDGIDGLAGSIGMIVSAATACIALRFGHTGVAMVAAVFAGATGGFLLFNRPPATIFLGDTGSMLIGLVCGTLAIMAAQMPNDAVLISPIIVLFTIPLLDTVAAIVRRRLTGRSIYTTDRGHIHHKLSLSMSPVRALLLLATATLLTSFSAVLAVYGRSDFYAIGTSVTVVFAFIATGTFGYCEYRLVLNSLSHALSSRILRRGQGTDRSLVVNEAVRLQGVTRWELLWEALVENGDKLGLQYLRLDVNLPRQHEGYHAIWRNHVDSASDTPSWKFVLPLVNDRHAVGSLQIMGVRSDVTGVGDFELLSDLLHSFEAGFAEMVGGVPVSTDVDKLDHEPPRKTLTLGSV